MKKVTNVKKSDKSVMIIPKNIPALKADCTAKDMHRFLSANLAALSKGELSLESSQQISSLSGKIINNQKGILIAKMWTGDKSGLEYFGLE